MPIAGCYTCAVPAPNTAPNIPALPPAIGAYLPVQGHPTIPPIPSFAIASASLELYAHSIQKYWQGQEHSNLERLSALYEHGLALFEKPYLPVLAHATSGLLLRSEQLVQGQASHLNQGVLLS